MSVHAHAAEEKFTVVDNGLDGEQRYYTVYCASDERAGVTHFYKTGKICMTSVAGKEKCLDKWDIDKAAKEACQ
jgi:hypothetical protein